MMWIVKTRGYDSGDIGGRREGERRRDGKKEGRGEMKRWEEGSRNWGGGGREDRR